MAQRKQRGVSLDDDTIARIQQLADSKGWSWSKAAAWLLDLGMSKRDVVEELVAAMRECERLRARLAARG